MDASWVAAVASVLSALVVGITAIAAFLQIRHVRNANEIPVYLRLYDRLDSAQTAEAFMAIDPFMTRLRTDPDLRRRMRDDVFVPEYRQFSGLLQFFEHLSALVAVGGMSERLILVEYAENIADTWDRCAEAVYLRRTRLSPYTGANFEHLAMRAKRFIADGHQRDIYRRLERDPAMATFREREEADVG